MKIKESICCLTALVLSLSICIQNARADVSSTAPSAVQGGNIHRYQVVRAIPETNFSDPNSLNLFGVYLTDGYPPKQLNLKGHNGVADFVQSPGFYFDAPTQPPHSSQILADGSTSYTKVIPWNVPFHVRFQVSIVQPNGPAPGPFGGTVFELHDTDPVFAQYGDPARSAVRLDVTTNGSYTFYVNNQPVWTAPYTLRSFDTFELNGNLQPDNSTANNGRLVLKRNGVVVAHVTGVNAHSMTPTYPPIIGGHGGSTGPAPHPLTQGPHVRLGLGKVPPPYSPSMPRTTTEVYIDNVRAVYWQ